MAMTIERPRLGIVAPGFDLPGVDGQTYALSDIMAEKGAVVVFICNHCPYVKAITERLVAAAVTLRQEGVGFAAICANDATSHPEDSFENMKLFAMKRGFTFPYLHDESQAVARAYEAVCTPDFYGIDGEGVIRYRGRLDSGRIDPHPGDVRPELINAMLAIARGRPAPQRQLPSVGCSIKWKAA
ncbi:MAG: thioredoxin family protein [Alphaproteobacteria bacterium]|nr:thioredoxin family protein [Alphaproteobacteria bacterium]